MNSAGAGNCAGIFRFRVAQARWMIRTTLCLIGLLCAVSGAASAVQIEQETFGCKSMADATQLLRLGQATDLTDYDTRLQKLVRAGECRIWTAADAVTVEDEGDGLVCLASSGMRQTCYWSAPEARRLAQP
ncbi:MULTISPECIES: hypothetical protein [Methylobacteriaceae]